MKHKIKLGIILGFEFVAITLILILIFFAGKKTYTVTFDLNGGTLISGEVKQTVIQGKNATAPVVAKEECYLRGWSTSFHQVTSDIVVKAIWEWQTKTSIGFDYTDSTNSDYCEITGSFKDLVGDVYINSYYNNKIVLGIQEAAFYNRDGITYVHMLDGILSIGNGAFEDCDELAYIDLPGTISKLGESVFKGCESLKQITLPDTLTVLGAEAFADCESLKSVVLSKNLKEISAGTFRDCSSLKKIVIPDGVSAIGAYAFEGCTSLKEIVIPASVITIDENAFEGCTALEKITFEVKEEIVVPEEDEDEAEDVVDDKATDENANDDNAANENPEENEQEVVLVGLISIGSGAFKDCTSLVEVVLPVTVEYIAPFAFDNEELVIKTHYAEDEAPEGWEESWHGAATVEWETESVIPESELTDEPEDNADEKTEKYGWLS